MLRIGIHAECHAVSQYSETVDWEPDAFGNTAVKFADNDIQQRPVISSFFFLIQIFMFLYLSRFELRVASFCF